MPVFKLCLKIFRKNLSSLLIYVFVFLGVAALVSTSSASNPPAAGFSASKTNVAFFSEEDTPLVEGLKAELSKTADFVTLPDEPDALQDALYYRDVTSILRVPKGFTESFLKGEDVQIEQTSVPNSADGAFVELNVDQYLNTAKLYTENDPDITQRELTERLEKDMNVSTQVSVQTGDTAENNRNVLYYYFNYLAYTLSAVLIYGISAVIIVFNNRDLNRRNLCAPVGAGSFNFQLFLSNLFFTALCWAIMVGMGLLLGAKEVNQPGTPYLLLNSVIFTLCVSSVSYLIGILLKNQNAISAVCNVVTLGPCFISGVFVPQSMLNGTVLKIASFTPTYWFVKANDKITSLLVFNSSSLSPVYTCMLVELLFTAAFFALALAVGKRKRMSEER